MPDDPPELDVASTAEEDGGIMRLTVLMVAVTCATAVLIVLTLPAAIPDGGMWTFAAFVAGGSVATIGAYLGVPHVGWLPFLPASITMALLVGGTGGSTSPYWPLLLVLLVGGATLSGSNDVLAAVLLVAVAAVSPLTYETWTQYATAPKALQLASWTLAALIVTSVSVSLRATRSRVTERTRLVSAVLGALPQQAAVVDRSGRILLTNDAWDRVHVLSGAPSDAFFAGATYRSACDNREGAVVLTATDLVDDFHRVLEGNVTTAVSELSWELLVGGYHRFTVRTTALPDRLGAVVTHEDITWLEEAERTRQRSLESLRDLDERKTALLRAVSHDIRTPLTVVHGVTDTLQRNLGQLDDTKIRELAETLDHQVRRLDRLLAGLLILSTTGDSAAATATGIVAQRQPSKLATTIDTVLQRVEPDGRPITVTGPALDLDVDVDSSIFEVVLQRLLDNAIQHTPPGTPIEIAVVITPGPKLVLRVSDHGPGIPTADRERIFAPFEQGGDGTDHDPGAGIGLSVVRALARVHGGDAWLDPTDLHTTFQVELDVQPAEQVSTPENRKAIVPSVPR